ncbi:MAG: hypothetical protein ACKV2O_17165 [Acidimicrobiales bacterium]
MSETSEGSAHQAELVYWWAPRGDERVFDLESWPEEALVMTRALFEEDGLEHSWEGNLLVVPAAQRDDAAGLLDEVVAASLPRLDEEADRTAYDLAGWPDFELEQLRSALDGAGLLYEWTDEDELLVYETDEALVDELFERLELRGPDAGVQLEGEALNELLTRLFMAADRLESDQDDTNAILSAHGSIQEVETLAVPYGIQPDTWDAIVADARALRRLIEHGADQDADDAGVPARILHEADDDDATAEDEVVQDATEAAAVDEATIDQHDDDADDDDADDDEAGDGDDDDEAMLYGDDAIRAVSTSLRDRLRRIL